MSRISVNTETINYQSKSSACFVYMFHSDLTVMYSKYDKTREQHFYWLNQYAKTKWVLEWDCPWKLDFNTLWNAMFDNTKVSVLRRKLTSQVFLSLWADPSSTSTGGGHCHHWRQSCWRGQTQHCSLWQTPWSQLLYLVPMIMGTRTTTSNVLEHKPKQSLCKTGKKCPNSQYLSISTITVS